MLSGDNVDEKLVSTSSVNFQEKHQITKRDGNIISNYFCALELITFVQIEILLHFPVYLILDTYKSYKHACWAGSSCQTGGQYFL